MGSLYDHEWSAESLLELVGRGEREGLHLDYKQAIHKSKKHGGKEDAREFLCDVAAFANADGGVIVYGVSEQTDAVGKNTGRPDKVVGLKDVNASEARLSLGEQILKGIEPGIQGLQIDALEHEDWGGPVIVIRIPRSPRSPHVIVSQPSFYRRHVEGKQPMNVFEVRAAFSDLEAAERLPEAFRRSRIEEILDTSYKVSAWQGEPAKALYLMHVFPQVAPRESVDLRAIDLDATRLLPISNRMGSVAMGRYLNYDGLLVERTGLQEDVHRIQVFGDARFEFLSSTLAFDAGDTKYIDVGYEPLTVSALCEYGRLIGPYLQPGTGVIVLMSWLHVYGRTVNVDGRPRPIDRPRLLLPDQMLLQADLLDTDLAATRLKPSFDLVWQACGLRESGNFSDGTFKM